MRAALILSLLLLAGCQHEPQAEKPDIDAGKHELAESDPRTWRSYPTLLLVATKHSIGIDTVAQIVKQFHGRFGGLHSSLESEVRIPHKRLYYEEDTHPIQNDVNFFGKVGQSIRRSPDEVAAIISDFYLIGAANRSYPEPNN